MLIAFGMPAKAHADGTCFFKKLEPIKVKGKAERVQIYMPTLRGTMSSQGSRGGLIRGSSVRWGNLQMEKPLRTLGREEETNALREGIDGVFDAAAAASAAWPTVPLV